MKKAVSAHAAAGWASLLLLVGCASFSGRGLEPGASTAAEVRRVMGEPERVCDAPQGGKRLVYSRGPMGRATFVATIGADGVLQGIENTLSPESIAQVQAGRTTKDDILCLFGSPWRTVTFPGSEVWYYSTRDIFGYAAQLGVEFGPDGVVSDMVEIRENISADSRERGMLGGWRYVPVSP